MHLHQCHLIITSHLFTSGSNSLIILQPCHMFNLLSTGCTVILWHLKSSLEVITLTVIPGRDVWVHTCINCLSEMSLYLTSGMYLLAAIKCCHRKPLVTDILICDSLCGIYFSTSASVLLRGNVTNTNQVLFRRVQTWIGMEQVLRICIEPLPMVVIISCVTAHDIRLHLRLLLIKHKLREE